MNTEAPKTQSGLPALLINLGLIAAVVAIAIGGLLLSGGPSQVSLPSFGVSTPDEWDPVLEPYIDFIETERGLTFDHPVNVRFTDISAEIAEDFAEFRELEELFESNAEAADPYGDAFMLLGLVDFDPNLDSQETTEAAIVENAGAFYDPNTEEIVLPEDESLVALQLTIVHELTHALQDQNGMLNFEARTADDSQARLALEEGDAERIAEAWFAQLSNDGQAEYLDSIEFDPDESFDDLGNSYLDATFLVSYGVGVPLVESIIETDGVEELNRLLRSSEVGSTERIIDQLGNSGSQNIDAIAEFNPPQGRDVADGDLGALAWFAVFAPAVGIDGAFDALVGYDDDAFAIYASESGDICGRFEIFFDGADEAVEFAGFAAAVGFEGVVDTERLSVTADICDQIGDPNDQNLAVLFPLIVANELVLHHLLMGEDQDIARCAALAQAKTLSVDQPLDEFVGFDAVFVDSDSFVNGCR